MATFELFLIFIAIVSSNAYESYNKTHYIYLGEWGSIDTMLKDGRVMYSNCTTNGAAVKNCTVVMERSRISNNSYVCDISLQSEHERGIIGKKMKLLGGLGSSKVLFFWKENHKRRGRYNTYGILNMDNCKFATVKFDMRSVNRKTAAVLYDRSFDVFYKDKTACGEKICRISFDADGNVLNKLHGFVEGSLINKDWILQPLNFENPELGHFYVRVEGTNKFVKNDFTTTYYLLRNGTQTLLKRLDGRPDVVFSRAHGVITACATYKKNKGHVNCLRFDPETNNLTVTILSNEDNKIKKVLSIRNIFDGSIAVLYKTSGYGDTYTNLTLANFDWKGELLKSTAVKSYCGKTLRTQEEEANYCIVNRCIKEPDNMWGEKEINFYFQCFDDVDLIST